MKDKEKVKQGKKSRTQGKAFEDRVRKDLEEKGYIVDRWSNNVDLDYHSGGHFINGKHINKGKLIKAKAKWAGPNRPMMLGAGFPDFIAYKPFEVSDILGIECKMTGELDKPEKEKCKWLLDNGVFDIILIAEKIKRKNKIIIEYHDFKEKYKRFI